MVMFLVDFFPAVKGGNSQNSLLQWMLISMLMSGDLFTAQLLIIYNDDWVQAQVKDVISNVGSSRHASPLHMSD